jgi:DNA invertase Pin-like site-specific DNA recombinase
METLHILVRVSTHSQEEERGGTSISSQSRLGIELSKKLKMKYQIHNEGGISSSKDTLDNRPVMINLLKLMDEGVCRHLWTYNTDRISRGHTWYFIRKKMVDNGVILYTSNGKYDTTGTMENLILGILSEVSMYDNKVRTERSRLGKMEKVRQNYFRGGDPPFGYRIEKEQRGSRLVINEYESEFVRLVYKLYSEGVNVKKIKEQLELEGVKTRRGNDFWSMGTIQLMLRNDTYIGIDEFHDKKTGTTIRNEIPSIIPFKLFEQVQEKRTRTLSRKGQMNRTTHEYLFRDFIYCSCGSPIGGRVKPSQSVYHYYCPLSERKFNKSQSDDKSCSMKRCVNIPKTEGLLWETIRDLMVDTIPLKEKLKTSILEKTSISSLVRKQRGKIKSELENKEIELKKITDGIVSIERKRIMNELTSEDVYLTLKKQLDRKYRSVYIEIENLKNTLRNFGQQDSWYETLEQISSTFNTTQNWTTKLRRSMLDLLLDKVILNHDSKTRLHHLDVHLRIPLLLSGNKKGASKDAPIISNSNSLNFSRDLIQCQTNHSTVTDFARFLGLSTSMPFATPT